jgi:putative nucleotidyltransferase with HDIG domain
VPSREESVQLLNEWVSNEGLRQHMLCVEAAVRFYARKSGEDEEKWGLAGLLHDLDWEKYPEEHPLKGVEELRKRGYDEDVLHAILAHRPDFTGVAPDTQLDKTLLACDEITGLVKATALMRPTGISDLEAKSVKKKMKDPAFARGVDREDVKRGAELLGVELDEHIANVIAAMKPIASEIGLQKA